jgi:hypothetical protein
MTAIEPNILSLDDLDDYAAAIDEGPLPTSAMDRLAELYADDFGLGAGAHPCDLKSSTAEGGSVRSGYVSPWREAGV